jgi:predicted lipoprotein with Yx(FWY)xxD motif
MADSCIDQAQFFDQSPVLAVRHSAAVPSSLSGSALAQSARNNMSNTNNQNPNSMGLKSLPAQVTATNKGETLVNVKGMTLYTYDKDGNG